MKTAGRQNGFTLLEELAVVIIRGTITFIVISIFFIGTFGMMVAAVIRGMLAVLVMPKFFRRSDQARELAAKQDIESLIQALQFYLLDNQRYPATEQGLQALLIQPTDAPFPANWKAGGYIGRLPKDPWGNPYQYLNPGVRGEIDIFSLGAEHKCGSKDNDTDLRFMPSHD